jgi:hypothetical protein
MAARASLVVTAFFLAMSGTGVRAQDAKVLEIENIVQTVSSGSSEWKSARVNQELSIRDRIRTRQRSRASVRLTSLYTMRMEQLTTIEISPPLLDDTDPKLGR